MRPRKKKSLAELSAMFPDDPTAERWFEAQRWPRGNILCPDCGSVDFSRARSRTAKMPYRCKDCRKYFSVRIGTVMQSSKISLQKWAIAIYLVDTSLKGISSVKLARDLSISQKSAWFMLQRIRESFLGGKKRLMTGPVEVDEALPGGKELNKHACRKLHENWSEGKTVVVGIKDRKRQEVRVAAVPNNSDRDILQGFVQANVNPIDHRYTDDNQAY